MKTLVPLPAVLVGCAWLCAPAAPAVTTIFFNATQTETLVSSNLTVRTISSSGYLFTYTQDDWWSATPGGPATGRFSSVLWPDGVDAQTLTAGPGGTLPTQTSASITIKRVDGMPFELASFTGRILGNTAGAGAAFEVMPQLNGNDAFANPLTYDATGYGGASFTYNPGLTGYDTYIISLWMDYALTHLTLVDASEPPALQVSMASPNQVRLNWPTNSAGYSLQQNSALNSTNWITATNAVSTSGTNYQVTVAVTNGALFFRLKL